MSERYGIRAAILQFGHFIRAFGYSGYDRRGNVRYLAGRSPDPESLRPEGVDTAVRDEALDMLCDAFDIPGRQRYCLWLDDELMALYKAMVGPRWWDDMEFERLYMSLDDLPGPNLAEDEFLTIKTVEDVIRVVYERRRAGHGCT